MTTPQEEAERRLSAYVHPSSAHIDPKLLIAADPMCRAYVDGFIAGAEWQAERLRLLVEAAQAWLAGDWGTLIEIAHRLGVAPTWADGKPRHMWDSVPEYVLAGDYATDARYVYPARDRLLRVVLAAAAALDEEGGK